MRPHNRLFYVAITALSAAFSVAPSLCAQTTDDNFMGIEVVVDADKGFFKSNVYSGTIGESKIRVRLGDISEGAHIVSFRAKDNLGNWSTTVTRALYVSNESFTFDGLEYFIDSDPGKGKATWVAASEGASVMFDVATANLASGPHTLTARLRSGSEWAATMTKPFTVIPGGTVLEYFYDNDPGVGNGTTLEAEYGESVVFLSTEGLSAGAHILSMRAKDSQGGWSTTVTVPLYVFTPDIDITAAEYFVDTDPGQGKANQLTVDPTGRIAFTVPTANLAVGIHTMTLRGKDASGTWYPVFEAPFEVLNDAGVEEIRWLMNIGVSRQNDLLTLTASDINPGCVVELYDLSGRMLTRALWHDITSPLTLTLDPGIPCCILMVTDPTGLSTVRKIR